MGGGGEIWGVFLKRKRRSPPFFLGGGVGGGKKKQKKTLVLFNAPQTSRPCCLCFFLLPPPSLSAILGRGLHTRLVAFEAGFFLGGGREGKENVSACWYHAGESAQLCVSLSSSANAHRRDTWRMSMGFAAWPCGERRKLSSPLTCCAYPLTRMFGRSPLTGNRNGLA